MSVGRPVGVAVVLLLACWCSPAQAFHPFDGTDAAIADWHQIEIEPG
jgi:hypothetical protein